jgi:Domain of unknown function (DUF5658)
MYYALKSELFPGFFIILLGAIDCSTTVAGILYSGAVELNPLMTSLISSNMMAFLALKISATLIIGFTYILAKRKMDNSTQDTKNLRRLTNGAYAGITIFLIIIVINNLIVILA